VTNAALKYFTTSGGVITGISTPAVNLTSSSGGSNTITPGSISSAYTTTLPPQGIICPYCEQPNEVLWPMDVGLTTIPKKQASK
jgi:hypothetical protein